MRLNHYFLLSTILLLAAAMLWPSPVFAQGFYSLHTHSYRKGEDARAEVEELRSRGLDGFSRRESVAGQGAWHRVYIGRFPSEGGAQDLAKTLIDRGLLSKYSNYRIMYVDGLTSRPVTEGSDSPPDQAEKDLSAFRESVEGSYVGSYTTKAQADEQAEGLTLRGWPAYVTEGMIRGKKWYRVYLSPEGKQYVGGRLKGFDFVVDMSPTALAGNYTCMGMSKFETLLALMKRINSAVPDLGFQAALRTVGSQPLGRPSDHTSLIWGLGTYNRAGYGGAINSLRQAPSDAPLGWAIAASDFELRDIQGKKALIIVSDFMNNRDLGQPLQRAGALKNKYGQDLCIYTIYVGADEEGIRLAGEIARVGVCGSYYDGCLLLNDPQYFDGMIKRIFYQTGCIDADWDGVCDDCDQCPGTPMGAPVDQRGCWVAAFAQYFDFDKDIVKKKYLPNLKQAADVLKLNPNMSVVIAGHTDSKGSYGYNMDLGARRADAVRKVLLDFGVSGSRLTIKSYGESKPIADNDTDKGRARNRRVEFEGWARKPYY